MIPLSRPARVGRLPRWAPMAGITLLGRIFVQPGCDGAIPHEMVHVAQQRRYPVWFWVSYVLLLPCFWNPWRVRWEAEAYAVDVKAGRLSAEEAARRIAGALYLWPCRYRTALRAVLRATKQ